MQRGYRFDYDGVRLDIYRLLSYVFASREFARHIRFGPAGCDPFVDITAYDIGEIERTLLGIAIAMRVKFDAWQREYPEHDPSGKVTCGTLWPDMDGQPQASESLTLREACNKIIHLDHWAPDVTGTIAPSEWALNHPGMGTPGNPGGVGYEPWFTLHGTKGRKRWKARLDLMWFAAHCSDCCAIL